MLPKILLINLFTMKMVLSQAVFSSSPTNTFPSIAITSAQGFPSKSPSAATPTALPLTSTAPVSSTTLASKSLPASPASSVSSIPALSLAPSPSAEAKAYFLPTPIPDPKVTILSDRQSIVGTKAKVSIADPNIIELNRDTDPGFIEVIGKFCDPQNTFHGDSKAMLPVVKENTVSPVKRLTMACNDNEPTVGVESLSYLQNQPVVCPGISKIDFVLVKPTVLEEKTKHPIEYEGLLDGFFTYLEI